MTVAPTSPMALAIDGVRTLLAQSSTFQTRCATYHDNETASEANALTHIFCFDGSDPEGDVANLRPFAVIGFDEHKLDEIVHCSAIQYLPDGAIWVELQDTARFADWKGDNAPDDQNDSFIDACNWMNNVFAGWSGTAGGNAAFPVRGVRAFMAPFRTPFTKRCEGNDFWSGLFVLDFGETKG